MTSSNEIIFFILVFVMMVVSAYVGTTYGERLKLKPTPSLLLSSAVTVLFLYFVYKITKVCGPSSVDGFHFEVTPAKLCDGGTYMTQTGPNHKMCKNMWATEGGRHELGRYNCLNGGCDNQGLYNGRPLHMERTTMSNNLWQNKMCDQPIMTANQPSVL